MTSDERKRELKNTLKERERESLEASIPLPRADLKDLFDLLDSEDLECDHTLRLTTKFLQERHLGVDRVVAWLREHGGFCDCEVIYHVEEAFGEFVGRERS
jgi:hypothetical protein